MCLVGHGYGWLGEAGMGVENGMTAGQSQGGGRISEDGGAHSEYEVKTLMTPDHTAAQVCYSG